VQSVHQPKFFRAVPRIEGKRALPHSTANHRLQLHHPDYLMIPDDTEAKQGVTQFRPGQSGNPNGRPKGSRNAATLALESLLDGEAEALTRKAIEMAKDGDMQALRLCLDRILPPRKDRPVSIEMPPIESAADAKTASAALLAAVAAGSLTPSEAAEIAKLVDAYVKAIEMSEVLARLEKLEQRL
jgi:hypothetical protein